MTYKEILKAKIDHYGETMAAYQFAGEEFERQINERLKKEWFDYGQKTPLDGETVVYVINDPSIPESTVKAGIYHSKYSFPFDKMWKAKLWMYPPPVDIHI